MPRKEVKAREKRGLPPPDYKYNSVLVSRFVSKLNFRGQKNVAGKIIYKAMDTVEEKLKTNPANVLEQAIGNVRPLLAVRPRRVGGATYQVPTEVPAVRGTTLAIRWVIQFARQRTGKPMHERLAEEIILASKKEGAAYKKREDTHKMAEANRAFAHYRW